MSLAPLGSRDPLRSETSCETHASLDPALKDFLDRVIIPALVREFTKTLLASSEGAEAQSLQHARREIECENCAAPYTQDFLLTARVQPVSLTK